MSPYEKEAVIDAIKMWVARHPAPDSPVIDLAFPNGLPRSAAPFGGRLSPRQIYNEIIEESEVGKWFLDVVESSADREGLKTVLAGFGVIS